MCVIIKKEFQYAVCAIFCADIDFKEKAGMDVKEYIRQNWSKTVKIPGSAEDKANFRMPVPYSTPCIDSLFTTFFYWDTYFTNFGLYADGFAEQAENNLITIRFFIKIFGFMPNAEHLITRSQPPLFTRGVYDYYKMTGDMAFLRECCPAIERELEFFESDRKTPCGLNAYGNHELNSGKEWYYREFDRRLHYTEQERNLDKYAFVSGLLAIAESGMDFNPRFRKPGNRFASADFAHLDLNCILYDAEKKASEIFKIAGDGEKSGFYERKAEARCRLINRFLLNKNDGIYYDYDFTEKKHSSVTSAVSLYPYALGISQDADGAKKVLKKLELPYGLSACEYRGKNVKYWQWDYPAMWPTNVYFCYLALKNCGLYEDASRIAEKYISTVDRCFAASGTLWEKYDAAKGEVSVTPEYKTPEMMGWTAGVYRYLQEAEKAENSGGVSL